MSRTYSPYTTDGTELNENVGLGVVSAFLNDYIFLDQKTSTSQLALSSHRWHRQEQASRIDEIRHLKKRQTPRDNRRNKRSHLGLGKEINSSTKQGEHCAS